MDPVSMIVMAIVTGATAALKPTAESVIKDAYAGVKRLIQDRYKRVSLDVIESDPTSERRRAVVQEDLEKAGAGQDPELLTAAAALLDQIRSRAPEAAATVGVGLEDVTAASATLRRIVAEGPGATGLRAKNLKLGGDLVVEDVQALGGGDLPKKQ